MERVDKKVCDMDGGVECDVESDVDYHVEGDAETKVWEEKKGWWGNKNVLD